MNSSALDRLNTAVKYLRQAVREASTESTDEIQQIVDLIVGVEEIISRSEFISSMDQINFDVSNYETHNYYDYQKEYYGDTVITGATGNDTITLG